jgi:hypothetical protein
MITKMKTYQLNHTILAKYGFQESHKNKGWFVKEDRGGNYIITGETGYLSIKYVKGSYRRIFVFCMKINDDNELEFALNRNLPPHVTGISINNSIQVIL